MEAMMKTYSVEEVSAMASHAELINNVLFVEDSTSATHNRVVITIATALQEYNYRHGDIYEVFTENVALYCNELCDGNNFFLPDVMSVCDKHGINDAGVHVAPIFVAEVTSESTKRNDYGDKMLVYRNIGVKEYWIVDIQRKIVFKYLESNQYVPEIYMYPEEMKVTVYPELTIDLCQFMKM